MTSVPPKDGLIVDVTLKLVTGGHACNTDVIGTMDLRSMDGGGGRYFVLDAENFSVDDIDELIDILTEFRDRFEPRFPGEHG